MIVFRFSRLSDLLNIGITYYFILFVSSIKLFLFSTSLLCPREVFDTFLIWNIEIAFYYYFYVNPALLNVEWLLLIALLMLLMINAFFYWLFDTFSVILSFFYKENYAISCSFSASYLWAFVLLSLFKGGETCILLLDFIIFADWHFFTNLQTDLLSISTFILCLISSIR